QAIERIKPVVKSGTIILTLQNGIENFRKLEAAFGDCVLQGICQIGTGIKEPGVILHSSLGHIVLGELSGSVSTRIDAISKILSQASISFKISNKIKREVWLKFGWNTVFNGLTAVLGVTVDALFSTPDSENLIYKLFDEVKQTAAAEGVQFDDSDIEKMIAESRKLTNFVTSTLRDRRQGKPMEYDGLTGALLRTAKLHAIELPAFSILHSMLHIADQSNSHNPSRP
ncbi:MAG: ketopantoate reductase family protein, partial [Balneolaceae bacterium]